jgi:hypothetical protein
MQLGALAQLSYQRGRIAAALEGAWASGDADPLDDELRRFAFSSDHNVGLVLFDEVMAWQTARAATLATDPDLSGMPAPGVDLLPTDGGVAGSAYLSATLQVNPTPAWRLYGGVLAAMATSDVVDPYRLQATGAVVNYRGGDPSARDLGIEIDVGVGRRHKLGPTELHYGLEAGVLLPGDAFADASGQRMDSVALARARAKLAF